MPAAVRREELLDGPLVHVQSSEKDPLLSCDILPLPPLHVLPDEYVCIVAYGASKIRFLVYLVLCMASCGILCIAVSWWPWLFTIIARKRGVGMDQANYVLLTDSIGDVQEIKVFGNHHRWFEYKKQRYLYSIEKKKFERVAAALHETCSSVLRRINDGMYSDAITDRLSLFGPNTIDIPTEPLHRVLFHKVVHPFYLFQLISVVLWLEEEYYTYSLAIFGMSLSSILYEVVIQVQNARSMQALVLVIQVQNARSMQALVQCNVIVSAIRDGKEQLVEAKDLVVGDIVLVDEAIVAADMILIAGECTVDESSLTGEAIPVTKVRLHDQKKYIDDKTMQKSAILSAGSTVLRINGDAKAVVQKTGFSTSKGELFRSILYPESISFRIVTDSYRYLLALGVIAIATTILRIIDAIAAHSTMYDLLISVFDLISTAIPAALPMVLTVGIGFSLTRLNEADIFCIDAQRINLSGHIDCFCFDKTGTLTTESVDFVGIDSGNGLSNDYSNSDLHLGLGSCHGLTENYGTILGYPLEMSMFGTTNFSLQTTSRGLLLLEYGQDVALYKERFAFDASVQRSSVIVKHL
ncbi:P-type ATPase (P-ATPase) Superfamily, partial [Thraustotheca clavata]